MKLIKGGNGSIPNWFRFDFLSHFLLSSFSIDFGSTIDRNQSTLIEVINSMSAEKSKSIEIDRNQIVPSLVKWRVQSRMRPQQESKLVLRNKKNVAPRMTAVGVGPGVNLVNICSPALV